MSYHLELLAFGSAEVGPAAPRPLAAPGEHRLRIYSRSLQTDLHRRFLCMWSLVDDCLQNHVLGLIFVIFTQNLFDIRL